MTKIYLLKKKIYNGLWFQTINKKAYTSEETPKEIVKELGDINPRMKFEIECIDLVS